MTDVVTRVEEARIGRGEDRIAVLRLRDRTVVVLADGAGGTGGGAAAADRVCTAAVEARQGGICDWAPWLSLLDSEMAARSAGLAAAVVLEILGDGRVSGASIGDCEVWVFGAHPFCLTYRQARKPLLGDGSASPVAFAYSFGGGTLVAATDGLWKYAGRNEFAEAARRRPLEEAAGALVDAARLPSGALPDDVAVAICEVVS